MTTIINTPPQASSESRNGMWMILGIIVLIAFLFAFFVYGLPIMRSSMNTGATVPQVTVPDKIDVNINQP